jgi:DNA-directed RNA polymerase specialized sigma24 family protein
MKYSEIAEILEISVKTVDAQMVKATKILRADLRFP